MECTRYSLRASRRPRRPKKCPVVERPKSALWKSQFQQVIGSVEKTLNKFAQDAAAVMRVFGQYCDDLGLIRQPAN